MLKAKGVHARLAHNLALVTILLLSTVVLLVVPVWEMWRG